MSLRAIADALLVALLAPPCAICGCVLERPLAGTVCEACWAAVKPRPVTFSLPGIARATAIGEYEGPLRDLIHSLKYERRRSIAPRLSALMAHHGHAVLSDADVVVPVPLHRRRRRHRGFNQADDLARGLGLPVMRVLRRVRATETQVDLPADQRRSNVRGAFALRRGCVTGMVVVLVDDVATTGATLEACARVLKAADVAEVRALTAARVATAGHASRRG